MKGWREVTRSYRGRHVEVDAAGESAGEGASGDEHLDRHDCGGGDRVAAGWHGDQGYTAVQRRIDRGGRIDAAGQAVDAGNAQLGRRDDLVGALDRERGGRKLDRVARSILIGGTCGGRRSLSPATTVLAKRRLRDGDAPNGLLDSTQC